MEAEPGVEPQKLDDRNQRGCPPKGSGPERPVKPCLTSPELHTHKFLQLQATQLAELCYGNTRKTTQGELLSERAVGGETVSVVLSWEAPHGGLSATASAWTGSVTADMLLSHPQPPSPM